MGNTHNTGNQQQANTKTEAEVKSKNAGTTQSDKSSHDHKSHTKAGTNEGAGGGKKQERHH